MVDQEPILIHPYYISRIYRVEVEYNFDKIIGHQLDGFLIEKPTIVESSGVTRRDVYCDRSTITPTKMRG